MCGAIVLDAQRSENQPHTSRVFPRSRMTIEHVGSMARFPHALGALAAAVALTAAGCTSASSQPSEPPPAPSWPGALHGDFAGLVDIGGRHKLFLECHGSGSPTVILQSGYG